HRSRAYLLNRTVFHVSLRFLHHGASDASDLVLGMVVGGCTFLLIQGDKYNRNPLPYLELDRRSVRLLNVVSLTSISTEVSLTATFRDVWPCSPNALGAPAPYKCGQKTTDQVDCANNTCSQNFEYTDFGRVYSGNDPDPGIVQNTLDKDNKPQFNPNYRGRSIIDPTEFPQWFRTTPNFNFPIIQNLTFFNCDPKVKDNRWNDQTGVGYWPLDNRGWGDWWNLPVSRTDHNFGFTMEIATRFVYRGGEIFTFNGDDDLWIFINNKLVVDLGGVHNGLQRTINLEKPAQHEALPRGGRGHTAVASSCVRRISLKVKREGAYLATGLTCGPARDKFVGNRIRCHNKKVQPPTTIPSTKSEASDAP
ncbi:periplasmic protein TonB links inner and outer membranes-like protein, partial [Planoprotostelium fungivorum]